MSFHLWNMISNLKNGQLSKKVSITQKKKKICTEVLNVLWDEGFILGYRNHPTKMGLVIIFLKYVKHEPSIRNIVSISKPSCRVYFSLKNIWKLESGVSLVIFSTNKGVCSTKLCKQLKIGGEPLIHLN